MRKDVKIRHLSMLVSASDQSYMPSTVEIKGGPSVANLKIIKSVNIPKSVSLPTQTVCVC